MNKIIIDTDIGDDIDDALAIGFALKLDALDELDVLGITTVYKNTKLRAKIACKLLETANREDIPVYIGCEQPLNMDIDSTEVPCQYTEEVCNYTPKDGAVQFIIDSCIANKEQVDIVCIGTLTNMARAILQEPSIVNSVKRIILMGGAYTFHSIEYNIICDPEAAKVVFESGARIIAVGIDVTQKCKLSDEQVTIFSKSNDPLNRFIAELIKLYEAKHLDWPVYLHDPLALSVIVKPEFLSFEENEITVELKGEFTRGMTYNISRSKWWEKEYKSNTKIVYEVDSKGFIRYFLNKMAE